MQRLGHCFDPKLVVEPTVHVEHMPEDKQERDHPGNPLQCVPSVSRRGIVAVVQHSTAYDDNAKYSMKDEGKKNEAPFYERQEFTKTMNAIDVLLKR